MDRFSVTVAIPAGTVLPEPQAELVDQALAGVGTVQQVVAGNSASLTGSYQFQDSNGDSPRTAAIMRLATQVPVEWLTYDKTALERMIQGLQGVLDKWVRTYEGLK